MRLEVKRKRGTFYPHANHVVSFLCSFLCFLVKGTPSQMKKHRFDPSYLESEDAGMN